MALFPILAAAIAPGIALLAYFYLKDRYDTEPIHMVVKMFVLGMLVVVPTIILQRGMIMAFGDHIFISAFLNSGAAEEFIKWFVLYHIIYNHTEFDEPYDGIVYAVAVALGFATLENIFYAWFEQTSFQQLLVRALLPVSGHALFGVMMGYYMGKAKFTEGSKSRRYLWLSLLFPIIWHGLFDYILLMFKSYWIWLIMPFMIVLWGRGLRKVNRANARSPFRVLKREEEVKL